MARISRRKFLKIAGTGVAGSVVACGCAARTVSTPLADVSTPTAAAQTPTETAVPVLMPDLVSYICGCRPEVHNPGGGEDLLLYIGNYCKYSERFLLHWNLIDVPADTKITKAVMKLYCVEIHGEPSGRFIYAPLISGWDKTVTYATQPENNDSEKAAAEWPAELEWQEVDVTNMVKQWIAEPEKNFGLIGYAVDVAEDTCSAVFASIQMSEDTRPRLIIT